MTDNDIVKTLESIASESIGDCKRDCAFYDGKVHYCAGVVAKHSLDIINRQKADIERITLEYAGFQAGVNRFADIGKMYSEIRAEAIKEFAERLKAKRGSHGEIWGNDIDNLVKEMTEETS